MAYTASNFAVQGMTKNAALELGQQGIRVNSIHPGGVETADDSSHSTGAEFIADGGMVAGVVDPEV